MLVRDLSVQIPSNNEPVPGTYIKANGSDYLVVLISDRNPIFSEENIQNVVKWMHNAQFKYVQFVPTGTLQRHSIALDMWLEKQTVNLQKAQKEGQQTEAQNMNRLLHACLVNDYGYEVKRWKPLGDKRKTPGCENINKKISFISADLTSRLNILSPELKESPTNSPLRKVNGFFSIDKSLIKSPDSQVRTLSVKLKDLQSLELRKKTNKISLSGSRNKFNFKEHVKNSAKENQVIELLQWSAITNDSASLADYSNASLYLENILNAECKSANINDDENFIARIQKAFALLVENVTQLRLTNFYNKNIVKYEAEDLETWCSKNKEEAKKFILAYLKEEIPYLHMLVETAVQLYKETGHVTYLAYPIGPSIKGSVFEFVLLLNEKKLKEFPAAFKIIDILPMFEKKYLGSSLDVQFLQEKANAHIQQHQNEEQHDYQDEPSTHTPIFARK